MLRTTLFVFVGGGLGAGARELLMLGVPHAFDGFPLDILAANVVAAFVLGIAAALHARQRLGDAANNLLGTGFCGGLSTFSSFVYASFLLITVSSQEAVVAAAYLIVSLILGYAAVRLGQRLGGVDG